MKHGAKPDAYSAAAIEAAIRERGCQQFGADHALLPRGQGWGIAQSPIETASALAAWHALGVRSVLEIGTYTGGFARFMAEVMDWDVTSVDVTAPQMRQGYTFVQVARDEHYAPTRRYDLVFIDGDHRYEGVRQDYANCAPWADKVVALHDVLGRFECEGVARFFGELQAEDKSWRVEISDEWPCGVGWREVMP